MEKKSFLNIYRDLLKISFAFTINNLFVRDMMRADTNIENIQ